MTRSERRLEVLRERVGPASVVWRAPGRVNIIGEHVDHAGGPVLPFACDLEVLAAVRPLPGRVQLRSLEADGDVTFALGSQAPSQGWGRYVRGVLEALDEAGVEVSGVRGVLSSDLPVGAGLSSSAALAAVLALALSSRVPEPEVLQRAEHLAVGVPCGVMDQVAVLHGRAGHAALIDCAALTWEHVPIDHRIGFVVVDTGTRRSLDDGRYAARRGEVQAALAEAQVKLGTRDPRRLAVSDVRRLRLPDPLGSRLRHVVTESARVPEAAAALRSGDVRALGEFVAASHASLRHDFEVSSPALDAAVQIATLAEGCTGARLVGAGFAGCVVAVVHAEAAASVARTVQGSLPGCRALVVRAVDGAGRA